MKNLLEYALGTNPLSADIPTFIPRVENGSFILEYDHAEDRIDVDLKVVRTEDLASQLFLDVGNEVTIGSYPNRVRKQISIPINQFPKSFFRLKATGE